VTIDPVQPDDGLRFVTVVYDPPSEIVQWTLRAVGAVERRALDAAATPDESGHYHLLWVVAHGRHAGRRILAGAGSRSRFRLWDADTGERLHVGQLADAHYMAINAVEFAVIGDRTYLLTGGHTCTLGIWSLDTERERHLWVGSQVWSIKSGSGRNVVLAGVRGLMGIEFREAP
jgi:WD40 repeat protein